VPRKDHGKAYRAVNIGYFHSIVSQKVIITRNPKLVQKISSIIIIAPSKVRLSLA
jgi:hypothetical protein